MKVTRILGTSILLLGVATAAFAQPAIRLSWDGCDPIVVNKNFGGPGFVRLVMSASNVSAPNAGHQSIVSIGPNVQDAWRFDSGACQFEAFTVSTAAVNRATCPAMQGAGALAIPSFTFDAGSGKASLNVANTYNLFNPDPALRYTLYKADFDHNFSDLGVPSPGNCGFAGDALCFHLVFTSLLLADGSTIPFVPEQEFVTWEDVSNDGGCPGATQNEPSTWGAIKGLYR